MLRPEDQATFYDSRYAHGYYYAGPDAEWAWAGRLAKARNDLLIGMIQRSGLDPNSRILEIGAGARPFSSFLPNVGGYTVVLTDISANALKHAEPLRGNEDIIVCDAAQLPLRPVFDLVIAVELIEHLFDPDAAMGAWASVLRPGGKLVITTPNARFSRPTDEHISLLEIDELLALYAKHDFGDVHLSGLDMGLLPAKVEQEGARLLSFFPALSGPLLGMWMRAPRNHPHLAQEVVAMAAKNA